MSGTERMEEIHSSLDSNLKKYYEWESTDLFVEAYPDIGSKECEKRDMAETIGHRRLKFINGELSKDGDNVSETC